ncbi:hypothetical protein GTY75_08650 [Streptomyces sp. SID8381]|uniref:hypothetical protein n=1 Tax=unclassified Streptomyces TaxID=2593676 RepID=UPI000367FA6A|nr:MULTISPECIES: hypothetical protein [unclassified Streptomyces]MYX26737.1 hypothetical protein [Streptomyces sp. SID8381]
MSTLHSVAAGSGVGAVLPLLTAIVQQPFWSARVKRIVAVVVAGIAGVVTVASTSGLDQFTHGIPTLGTIGAVLAASQAAHDLVWKPSAVTDVIESKTAVYRAESSA